MGEEKNHFFDHNLNGYMKKYNAVINIISSRVKCLPHCLKSLWINFNQFYNYDVVIYYFDDIYNDKYLKEKIISLTDQNVEFISVPYKTPDFLNERELFYARSEIEYVKTSFPISRKGYLHMCNFTSNMYDYDNTTCKNYDFIITHDDESGYIKKMRFNPIDILVKENSLFGAYSFSQRLKNGKPHQGHFDTRIGLYEFCKYFISKYNISPKSQAIRDVLNSSNPNYYFHFLEWADTYVIDTTLYRNENWKTWISEINDSGGIYKYRWGDNEVYSLFGHIFLDNIVNLNIVNDGYHDQGLYRNLCDVAPGVKNNKL